MMTKHKYEVGILFTIRHNTYNQWSSFLIQLEPKLVKLVDHFWRHEILGSHGGKYKDYRFIRCRALYKLTYCPDDRVSTHLWNVGQLQRDYAALHPRRL
jgi:hypothetical protein